MPLVVRAGGQPRVAHRGDVVAPLQPGGHRQGVVHVPLHAQRERLDALGDEEGRVRRQREAEVALALGSRLEDEGQVCAQRAAHPQVPGVDQAVVGLVGRVEAREALGLGGEVEAAGVHDHARHGRAVPAQELRRRGHHDVRAPLEGAGQERRGHRVVHDQRDAQLVRGRRDRLDVEDVAARVGDRLPEEGDGALVGQRRPGRRIARLVHEARLDAQARQGVGEQVRGAAVQGGGGHDVVARPAQRHQGEGRGRLPRRRQQRPDTTLQGRDPLLDDVIGGVVQARVDRAQVAQGEAGGRLLGRLEDVGGGLVDRDGPGVGGLGHRIVPGLNLLGLKAPARRAGGGGDRLRALGGGLVGGGGVLVGHEDSLVVPGGRRRCQCHERCLPRAGGCGAPAGGCLGCCGPASEAAGSRRGRGVVALSRPPSPLLQLL